ncbi:hypothetical protein F5B17DRAFT_424786, partial [Nemania serpens]
MYNMFMENGIVHGDPKVHNFIRTEHGIIAINLKFTHVLLLNDVRNEHELHGLIDEISIHTNVATVLDKAEMHYFQPFSISMFDRV